MEASLRTNALMPSPTSKVVPYHFSSLPVWQLEALTLNSCSLLFNMILLTTQRTTFTALAALVELVGQARRLPLSPKTSRDSPNHWQRLSGCPNVIYRQR